MKSITNFILENLSKLDLAGIHYSITSYDLSEDRNARYSNAKKQEAEVIDTISELYPDIKVMSLATFADGGK